MSRCTVRLFSFLGVALALLLPPAAIRAAENTLTSQELQEGWVLLFDGQTLFGWKAASKADWQVRQGAIVVGTGEPGLLTTTSQFGNYALKVDFRAPAATNSGVFLRTSPAVKPEEVAHKCYELNIAPSDNPFPTGSFVQRKKAAAVEPSADWQTMEVMADGGRFTVKIGGRQVLEYTDPKPLGRGYIGLQFNQGKIEFRNIKLKPLGLQSMFNGKDLSGWKTYPELPSRFTVTPEGWLNVKNGRGALESEKLYGDFTLQLEAFVNGKQLNSGIFYRAVPGEPAMNGYESQIHNGYLDNDRTKPVDHGTGGIFRRQPARKVVADDFRWFHKTIHADGKHVAVWVEGYQVTDWTDTRPEDENPRKGLRLKPGSIMIQGHDPTTDLSFRNLRIVDLPPR